MTAPPSHASSRWSAASSRAPCMTSGGVARNGARRAFLAESLGSEMFVPEQPQLMGAYGAALLVRGAG